VVNELEPRRKGLKGIRSNGAWASSNMQWTKAKEGRGRRGFGRRGESKVGE